MKTIIVIPARYASTRLPRKLLLAETGKPLIQHTYEAALRAKLPQAVLVACDHDEIEAAVKKFGGNVVRTNPAAPSGTDRVAEAVASMHDVEIVINVQGDEPDLAGEAIDYVARLLEENPQAVMATLATPIRSRAKLEDAACVKVVIAENVSKNLSGFSGLCGEAIYFSRSVIPHPREWDDARLNSTPPAFLQHIGIYAYRRDFLLSLTKLPPSRLEQIEKLEQLRVLENGYKIMVGIVPQSSIGIDTPEDYREFVMQYTQNG